MDIVETNIGKQEKEFQSR